jgi:DNA repair protein RecN (Recombination protein N)
MLRTLSIRDFVIVDTIELEFSSGFSVFTGETGAGKSILIDALNLALGGRGEASVVREGMSRADISADFSPGSQAEQWLVANALQVEEGGVLLRRVIDNAGRSKAYINGIAATATQLRELGEMLVDIHGQHAHQSLLKAGSQRQLLDAQGALENDAKAVATFYKAWRTLVRQREEFERDTKNNLLEQERLEWQVSELQKLAPQTGEWETTSQEFSRLSHAASLIEGAQEALDAISEDDHPMLSQLTSLTQKLEKLADIDDALKPVLELLEPARIQLQEAAYGLTDYLGRVELDPARLRAVESRMAELHAASRKYHVQPERLPEHLEELATRLTVLVTASDPAAMHVAEQAAFDDYAALAKKLSKSRTKAAASLSVAVTAAMQDLSMTGGQFSIALTPSEPAAYGLEQVEFMVAGHAGTTLRPLAKVASGGELARIALAISVITSSATATPTLIFDEVDSGIGGGVAEVVGRLLKKLGQDRQVLCVTHLPQVASQALQHFEVSKATDAGKPVSRINSLDAPARVEEIARMLGGLEITATTRKHARELLSL